MIDDLLVRIFTNQYLVLIFVSLVILIVTEIGFHFGLRLHAQEDDARVGQVGGIQAAVLGLLALLLGFTFAMSVSRYDARRTLVVDEANGIETTFLRAALLSDERRGAVESLLKQYVDVRLQLDEAGEDRALQDAAEEKAAQIQTDLWTVAIAAAKESPTPVTASFITSLNETIDLDAARLHAARMHVPGAVWLLVLIVAACGCYLGGYGAGTSGERNKFASLMLPLLVAVVISLIADLDSPREGLIRIEPEQLIELRETLDAKTR